MNSIIRRARFLLLLMLALTLAQVALACDGDSSVITSSASPLTFRCYTPGSGILFPKWIAGTVVVDGVTLPQTEIELGAVCPVGVVCAEHLPIKVRFHWVCGGDDKIDNKYICPATDFDVFLTVDGKAVFDPNNIAITGSQFHHVSLPPFNLDGTPCTRGYLIGYAVDTSDRPVRFDGLIGDGVIRNTATSTSAYRAIPITADPALANYDGTNFAAAAIKLAPDPFNPGQLALPFGALGGYRAIDGQLYGDVKYDDPVGPSFSRTNLTLLTLSVRLNQPNYPTFVDFNFWSEDEVIESTSLHFVCYGQFQLSKIDANLTKQQMGFRKGVFQSGQAFKSPIGGINDVAGFVCLFGLIHTFEGPDITTSARTYIYEPYHNNVPIPTEFLPPCNVLGQC